MPSFAGLEHAASEMLTHQWQRARAERKYGLANGVVRMTQLITDLANWGRVQVSVDG